MHIGSQGPGVSLAGVLRDRPLLGEAATDAASELGGLTGCESTLKAG